MTMICIYLPIVQIGYRILVCDPARPVMFQRLKMGKKKKLHAAT